MGDTAPESGNDFKLYHYHPSLAAAAIFVLLFLATTILHGWQMFRTRCWIAFPVVLGGLRKFARTD